MERLVDFRNWTGKESASIQYMAAHNYYIAMKALARAQVRILIYNTYKLITHARTYALTHTQVSLFFFFVLKLSFFILYYYLFLRISSVKCAAAK